MHSKKRIVIKIGTSSLTHDNGSLNLRLIDKLAEVISDIQHQGHEVILVSSGAISVGRGRLKISGKKESISVKQALAAVGQGMLMHIYEKKFAEYGATAAQVLLVRDDMAVRKRFLNARNTILELLRFSVVPIINENDTVSVDEIRFGDNDSLAAMVAILVDADLVILLTDIDGFYTENPRKVAGAKKLDQIDVIDACIERMAGEAGSDVGTGGMRTKVEAAKIATASGIPLLITEGAEPAVLYDILDEQPVGTLFVAHGSHISARKSWLAYGAKSQGALMVDDGCKKALTERGKSLLPSGIVQVSGHFDKGDVIDIRDKTGHLLCKGITNYNSEDIGRIKGCQSREVSELIFGSLYHEVVHRDNMGFVYQEGQYD